MLATLKYIFYQQLFENLFKLKSKDEIFSKIQIIDGDLSKICLGISLKDQNILKDTTMIFHFAATVKFTEKFKTAIELNVRGVRELLKLSQKMKNLKLFCHTSTAYSNLSKKVLEEKIYETEIDPELVIEIAESHSENYVECFFKSYNIPSYFFTKTLAEKLIENFHEKFKIPSIICRPAIIWTTALVPYSGWNYPESFFNKFMLAGICGVLRSIYIDGGTNIHLIPGDYFVHNLMLSTWNFLENP